MYINVWQIDSERDDSRVAFLGFDGLWYCDNIGWRRCEWLQDTPKEIRDIWARRTRR